MLLFWCMRTAAVYIAVIEAVVFQNWYAPSHRLVHAVRCGVAADRSCGGWHITAVAIIAAAVAAIIAVCKTVRAAKFSTSCGSAAS